jgi:putative redox protein
MGEGIASGNGDEEAVATAEAVHRGPGAFPHTVRIREHVLEADEPPAYGGHDSGPDPTELLAAALASCTSMTLRSYAERKGWDLQGMSVAVRFHEDDGEGRPGYDLAIDLPDALDDAQAQRLEAIARKCPVRRALTTGASMREDVRRTSQAAPERVPRTGAEGQAADHLA